MGAARYEERVVCRSACSVLRVSAAKLQQVVSQLTVAQQRFIFDFVAHKQAQRRFFFNVSEHADGERRGPVPI